MSIDSKKASELRGQHANRLSDSNAREPRGTFGPFVLAPAARVIVFGRGGDDRISAAASMTRSMEFHGDEGDDSLTGAAGNDLLLGGIGHDRLSDHGGDNTMDGGEGDWPRLALELGYFDQAHFIKAFKAVIGRSPADYASASASVAAVG